MRALAKMSFCTDEKKRSGIIVHLFFTMKGTTELISDLEMYTNIFQE